MHVEQSGLSLPECVYLSMYVCLYFTLWLDDVVWANLLE